MLSRRLVLGGALAIPLGARASTWPAKPIRVGCLRQPVA